MGLTYDRVIQISWVPGAWPDNHDVSRIALQIVFADMPGTGAQTEGSHHVAEHHAEGIFVVDDRDRAIGEPQPWGKTLMVLQVEPKPRKVFVPALQRTS